MEEEPDVPARRTRLRPAHAPHTDPLAEAERLYRRYAEINDVTKVTETLRISPREEQPRQSLPLGLEIRFRL